MASLSEESLLGQMTAILCVQYQEDLSMIGQKSLNIITKDELSIYTKPIIQLSPTSFVLNDFQLSSWFIVVFIPLLSREINKELNELAY